MISATVTVPRSLRIPALAEIQPHRSELLARQAVQPPGPEPQPQPAVRPSQCLPEGGSLRPEDLAGVARELCRTLNRVGSGTGRPPFGQDTQPALTKSTLPRLPRISRTISVGYLRPRGQSRQQLEHVPGGGNYINFERLHETKDLAATWRQRWDHPASAAQHCARKRQVKRPPSTLWSAIEAGLPQRRSDLLRIPRLPRTIFPRKEHQIGPSTLTPKVEIRGPGQNSSKPAKGQDDQIN